MEESETVDKQSGMLSFIHTLGVADSAVQRHNAPSPFPSPLSFYYQFLYHHDTSQYIKAYTDYSALQYLLPWWQDGIDRFSSVLFVLKKEADLESLVAKTKQNEPHCREVALLSPDDV